MDGSFIPFHKPSIGDEEIGEVVETLKSGWLTTGPRAARFEREFRQYVGAPHAVALNSCTAALHLALAGLKIGPGDEVITTPMTFCGTVHAILHTGATPVMADIGPDGNIDPEEIVRRITVRTRAILPVHLAGLPCDLDAIRAIARKHGLFVIEDAAHAAGAQYRGRRIGAHCMSDDENSSDAVAFSFYSTKNITTGEGGMLTTGNAELADSVRMLSLHGLSHDAWDRYTDHGGWHYDVVAHGYKYNLSDIHAALGIHQLRKLEGFVRRRQWCASFYNREFGSLAQVELPPDRAGCRHAWHLYILRLNLDELRIDREEFIRALRQKGIGTSVHFIPIPLHPFFSKFGFAECPRALNLYQRIVSLPLYPAMTDEEVQFVAKSAREILESARSTRLVAMGAGNSGGSPKESYE